MLLDLFRQKSRDALINRDSTLRAVMGNILSEFEKCEKSEQFTGWIESGQIAVVRRYVKCLKSAIELFPEGNAVRESYLQECAILESFLPRQMDYSATNQAISVYLMAELETSKSLGKFMKTVTGISELKGLIDPTVVRRIGQESGLK